MLIPAQGIYNSSPHTRTHTPHRYNFAARSLARCAWSLSRCISSHAVLLITRVQWSPALPASCSVDPSRAKPLTAPLKLSTGPRARRPLTLLLHSRTRIEIVMSLHQGVVLNCRAHATASSPVAHLTHATRPESMPAFPVHCHSILSRPHLHPVRAPTSRPATGLRAHQSS